MGYAPAPKPRRPSLVTTAPAALASLAISVGVILLFLANLLIAVGAPAGATGRERFLQFLSPADLAVGAALALAVALVVLHGREAAEPGAAAVPSIASIGLIAGIVAAAVAAAALFRGITELTIPHQHAAVKLGELVDSIAAIVVAGAAAVWGLYKKK